MNLHSLICTRLVYNQRSSPPAQPLDLGTTWGVSQFNEGCALPLALTSVAGSWFITPSLTTALNIRSHEHLSIAHYDYYHRESNADNAADEDAKAGQCA